MHAWRRFGGTVLVLSGMGLLACRSQEESALGRDCAALIEAARHAEACDPKLAETVAQLRREPDEKRCRVAVRTMLHLDPPEPPALRSVHAEDPVEPSEPLSPDELGQLRDLSLPATLILIPDVPPGPGVTRTRASIDGVDLVADEAGRLVTTISPGARTLQLHHGSATTTYCLELRACESLSVKAHGSRLARHPDVRPGAC
jgi:hypothetical protein